VRFCKSCTLSGGQPWMFSSSVSNVMVDIFPLSFGVVIVDCIKLIRSNTGMSAFDPKGELRFQEEPTSISIWVKYNRKSNSN